MTEENEEWDEPLYVNEFVTITNVKNVDNQIYVFNKYGIPHDYIKITGKLQGDKIKAYVCLKDDSIYQMERI